MYSRKRFRKGNPADEGYIKFLYQMMRLRVSKGLTQMGAAELMNCSQSAVGRFENGTYNPSYFWIQRYAALLGADLEVHIMVKNEKID